MILKMQSIPNAIEKQFLWLMHRQPHTQQSFYVLSNKNTNTVLLKIMIVFEDILTTSL